GPDLRELPGIPAEGTQQGIVLDEHAVLAMDRAERLEDAGRVVRAGVTVPLQLDGGAGPDLQSRGLQPQRELLRLERANEPGSRCEAKHDVAPPERCPPGEPVAPGFEERGEVPRRLPLLVETEHGEALGCRAPGSAAGEHRSLVDDLRAAAGEL